MAAEEFSRSQPGEESGGEVTQAEVLKAQGNEHFKAQRSQQAAMLYRQALGLLRTQEAASDASASAFMTQLGQSVRMNLVTCLRRLGNEPMEILQLCDEVLVSEPTNAKALFGRAVVRRDMARSLAEGDAARRDALSMARRDLVEAAKLQPADRQVREKLEEVTEELRTLSGFADKLRGGFARGIEDERSLIPAVEPEPPLVCSNCERVGHARCGKQLWIEQRGAWLQMPVEEVDKEPESFEDDGPLMKTVRSARIAAATADGDEARAAALARYTDPGEDADDIPELSDGEREMLEDCLDSTERPYPRLKKPLHLAQAVRCAEELWDDD